jgi:4-amino-4-deoxy-L-arabinose transferase-like glycosyltransferase
LDWPLAIVVAAVLGGAALRLSTLALQSFDEDETVTVWLVHLPLPKLLATIPRTESTPPFYYILAWLWSRVFGSGAVAIRSLSASIGVVVIPVCYLAARQLLNRRAGAIAAVLAALSPALIWYSQEARSYELLILTSAGALLFFVRSLEALRGEGRSSSTSLGLWASLASLSLTTHYFAAFLIAPQALWLLVGARHGQRRAVVRAVAAVAVVGLALAPLALRQQENAGTSWIGLTPLGDRLADVPPQLLLGEGRPFYHFFGLAVGLAAVGPLIAMLIRGGGERRAPLVPVAIGVAGLTLPALIDAIGPNILIDRNTLGAGVVLLIACAVGMAWRGPAWLGLGAFAGVSALFVWALILVLTNPLHQREPWREAAAALGQPSVARAVLYGPATNNPPPVPPLVPFQAVYLKTMLTMPDRGWTVREVDVLNVRDDLSETSTPPYPISPGREFRLVGRVRDDTYVLFRFRSRRPVHVTPDELIGENLLANREENETLVGLQIPRSDLAKSLLNGHEARRG